MPRGTRTATMTLGFIGSGKVSKQHVTSLLSDLLDSREAHFVVPITKDHWNDGIQAVLDFAADNDIPFEAVVDDSTGSHKAHKKYLDAATATHKVVRVANKIVKMVGKADGKMIFLWDDEDDDAMKALELSSQDDVEALDLTNALDRLEIAEGDEEDEEETTAAVGTTTDDEEESEEALEDEPDPVAEEKPKRGRSRKSKASKKQKTAPEIPVDSPDDIEADALMEMARTATRVEEEMIPHLTDAVKKAVLQGFKEAFEILGGKV